MTDTWGMVRMALFVMLWSVGVAFAQAPVWRVVSNEFPPYVGQELPQQGFYAALVRRALAELGVTMELHFQPPARAHSSIASGQFDAAFPLLRTTEREREFIYSDPLLVVRSYLFVLIDSPIEGVADLPGKRTCHLQGSNQPAPVQRMAEAGVIKVARVAQMAQCFEMMARGRVDFVAVSDYGGWAAARQVAAGAAGFKRVGSPLSYGVLHLVWSRQDARAEQRAAEFNRALAEIKRRGVVQQLEQALLPALPDDDQPPTRPLRSPIGRGR